ncbi:MAG: Vgb family protein, partial [Candidatus Geothermincolia bacterium]
MFACKRAVSRVLVFALLAALILMLLPAEAQASNVKFTVVNIPTNGCWAMYVTPGADGAMWFSERAAGKIGRITVAGAVTEYDLPDPTCSPYGIITGPDGNMWFTENDGNKIGKMSTAGVVLAEYNIPTANSKPWQIVPGPDGALWFTESNAGKIGRITTAGAITEYPLAAAGTLPMGITRGPDGALWFTEFLGGKIGRITTAAVITEFAIPTAGGNPVDLVTGPDGALWFTEETGNSIGRMTTSGAVTEFPVPTATCQPMGITSAPDGALWFTEFAPSARKLGRITPQGIIAEFPLTTTISQPNRICVGTDGRLWFAESAEVPDVNRISAADITQPLWFLAEGSTNWGYSCYITVENPNVATVHAEITYNTSAGPVDGGTVPIPGASQLTINPADKVGQADFSTRVSCQEGETIAVDRTMIWTGGTGADTGQEAHNSVGVTEPACTWYLAEGSSAWGFECWLLIQNPNATPATCNVTYMIEGGTPVTRPHAVPARSRATYNMVDEIGSVDASIKVVSDKPVIPERAMYRNARREGHDSIGTTAPSTSYFLAEGTTAWGFTTFVLIQNPTANEADVNLTYMTGTGAVPYPGNPVVMPANSRKTIRVNDLLPDRDFSTKVESNQPIIAERAMYWNSSTGEVCHDSIGMSASHRIFYLPDGQSSDGHETFTLVQNPNPGAIQVEIKYLTPTGTGNVTKTETIPGASRQTFNMLDHSAISGRAAIVVKCLTAGKKIMVERAMYWNSRGTGT